MSAKRPGVGAPAGQGLALGRQRAVVDGDHVVGPEKGVELLQSHALALRIDVGGVDDDERVGPVPLEFRPLAAAQGVLHRQGVEPQTAQQLALLGAGVDDGQPHGRSVRRRLADVRQRFLHRHDVDAVGPGPVGAQPRVPRSGGDRRGAHELRVRRRS